MGLLEDGKLYCLLWVLRQVQMRLNKVNYVLQSYVPHRQKPLDILQLLQ